jgi:hypothetical protein
MTHVLHRSRQRGELMNDHLWLHLGNRPGDLFGIQRVGHHSSRPQPANALDPRLTTGHPRDLVTGGEEPWDEMLSQRACGTCDKNFHDAPFHLPLPLTKKRRGSGSFCDRRDPCGKPPRNAPEVWKAASSVMPWSAA